jgi:hypothetical protein
MMLRHMGWTEAADLIIKSMEGDRLQEGHLRLRPPDGRRDPGVVLGLWRRDDRADAVSAVSALYNSAGRKNPARRVFSHQA